MTELEGERRGIPYDSDALDCWTPPAAPSGAMAFAIQSWVKNA